MLIIVDDDATYRWWLLRHRDGFVVDCQRHPTKGHVILHRATCPLIKPHGRARLTSGAHIKVCAQRAEELAVWSVEQVGREPQHCAQCAPALAAADHAEAHAWTRLGKEIVSYVLDLAVIYLDGEAAHFRPTIGGIAQYLEKTPAQIRAAVERLVADGYLERDPAEAAARWSDESLVRPTARALASIPAFGAMSSDELRAELDRLPVG